MPEPKRPSRRNPARVFFEGDIDGSTAMKASLVPLQQALLSEAKNHRDKMAEARRTGRWNKAEDDAGRWAIVEAYFTGQETARLEIDSRLKVYEEAWQKNRDPQREMLTLARAQQRYGAMGKDELDAEVERYAGSPGGRDPLEVESLYAAARRAGADGADTMRRVMADSRYDQPWLEAEEPRKLMALRQLYAGKLGEAVVATPMGVDNVRIEDLFHDDE